MYINLLKNIPPCLRIFRQENETLHEISIGGVARTSEVGIAFVKVYSYPWLRIKMQYSGTGPQRVRITQQ
jgi:hypothetical protein